MAFVLDLTDRADLRWAGNERLPRLASTNGACAASLPVPIMLKGYQSNIFQEKLRTRSLAGSSQWRWPSTAWEQKSRRVVWRGSAREYSQCLELTRAAPGVPCQWRKVCDQFCYHQGKHERGGATAALAAMGRAADCPRDGIPHPRLKAVAANLQPVEEIGTLQLDARLTPCTEKAECSAAALRARGLRVNDDPVAFPALANSIGVLELDGYGWQASLLAKLTLGSVVLAQRSLFPLWYDDLLHDGVHLLRTTADLADLPTRLRWMNKHSGEARRIARAGQARACELLHIPHLARLLRRLLAKYADLFAGAYPSHLHTRTRRRPRLDARVDAPEWLWLKRASRRESSRALCDPWWRGVARCNRSSQSARAS